VPKLRLCTCSYVCQGILSSFANDTLKVTASNRDPWSLLALSRLYLSYFVKLMSHSFTHTVGHWNSSLAHSYNRSLSKEGMRFTVILFCLPSLPGNNPYFPYSLIGIPAENEPIIKLALPLLLHSCVKLVLFIVANNRQPLIYQWKFTALLWDYFSPW
jgi:hypothetical protein